MIRRLLAIAAMALMGLTLQDAAAAAVQGLQQGSIRAIFVESGDGVIAGASNCSSADATRACFEAASYTGWAAEIAMEVIVVDSWESVGELLMRAMRALLCPSFPMHVALWPALLAHWSHPFWTGV